MNNEMFTHRAWKETFRMVIMRVYQAPSLELLSASSLLADSATYHEGARPSDDPSNPMCVPIQSILVPKRRLVGDL